MSPKNTVHCDSFFGLIPRENLKILGMNFNSKNAFPGIFY